MDMIISNLVRATRFWNNLHQVRIRSKSKDWKANIFLKSIWEQANPTWYSISDNVTYA